MTKSVQHIKEEQFIVIWFTVFIAGFVSFKHRLTLSVKLFCEKEHCEWTSEYYDDCGRISPVWGAYASW